MEKIADFGLFAEHIAIEFLKQKGYQILDAQFRQRFGELDVVAQKGSVLVFVEVKASYREVEGFRPIQRITKEKLKRVMRTARAFLLSRDFPPYQEWQVDGIVVSFKEGSEKPQIDHLERISEL